MLPAGDAARWFILHGIRQQVRDERLRGLFADMINRFLRALPDEHQLTLLADLVDRWGALGADDAMFDVLKKVARTLSTPRCRSQAVDEDALRAVARGLRMITVPFPICRDSPPRRA